VPGGGLDNSFVWRPTSDKSIKIERLFLVGWGADATMAVIPELCRGFEVVHHMVHGPAQSSRRCCGRFGPAATIDFVPLLPSICLTAASNTADLASPQPPALLQQPPIGTRG
jgi:hypothetical protein